MDLMKPDTKVVWKVNQSAEIIIHRVGIVVGTGSSPDCVLVKFERENEEGQKIPYEKWVSKANLFVLDENSFENIAGKGDCREGSIDLTQL